MVQMLHDRYRILKLLGRGGFGTTFLAVDEQQGAASFCVIKQLSLQGSPVHHPTATDLFHREVQRLAELEKHRQIPNLLHTFEQDGQAFIVQEWIDGWTLEQAVAETGPFDEIEVWQVLWEVLPILQYLHDRHIIHRDVKPANIIHRRSPLPTSASLDQERKRGNLVLVDFGAAKHLGKARSLYTGTMIGSAEYAAPEQVRGHAVFASDLYSLGITCLYFLTHMSPFDLYDTCEDTWQWQVYLTHPISPFLTHILYKLLQPATRRRYQSAAEVLADMDAGFLLDSPWPLPQKTIAQDLDSIGKTEPLDAQTQHALTTITAVQAARATDAIATATVYIPETQNWYCLTPEREPSDIAYKVALFLGPRLAAATRSPRDPLTLGLSKPAELPLSSLRRQLFKSAIKGPVELVFSMMMFLMLVGIGSMALICVFFEMERRSPLLKPEIRPSLISAPNLPRQ